MPSGVCIRTYKRKFSKQACENIRKARLKQWKDPEYIKMQIASHKGKHNSPATEFKKGHSLQGKGCKNSHWTGGKHKNFQGYMLVRNSKHPFAQSGYVLEHRLEVEKQIGRYLTPKEIVHHIGERDDNRPCMLIAFSSKSAHQRFHKDPQNVKSEETIFDGRKL